MGQTSIKGDPELKIQRKIQYIQKLLDHDPSLAKYSAQYKMVINDLNSCLQR